MTTMPALTYLVREPKIKIQNPPVLILLHGVGSNERDLFSFADVLPEKFLIISARGPYALGANRYAWYEVDFSTGKPVFNKDQEAKSRKTILTFIDQLKQLYNIDETQIYIGGFSQGAIMSYSVGLTHPEKVKGIIALSGRLLEEIKPIISKSEDLKQLEIFIAHGSQDRVLNVQYAHDAVGYLKNLGLATFFREYNEGHSISREELGDLVNWLAAKQGS